MAEPTYVVRIIAGVGNLQGDWQDKDEDKLLDLFERHLAFEGTDRTEALKVFHKLVDHEALEEEARQLHIVCDDALRSLSELRQPDPGKLWLWDCPNCSCAVQTSTDFHINFRPICVQCNNEMVPRQTAEDYVKNIYPEATCIGPVTTYWPEQGYSPRRYLIIKSPIMSNSEGSGTTEEEAWNDAAMRISEKQSDKTKKI